MRILFKFPTRERPEVFRNVLNTYYNLMSHSFDFKFLITLDKNDSTMFNKEIIDFMHSKKNLIYIFGESKNKINVQ